MEFWEDIVTWNKVDRNPFINAIVLSNQFCFVISIFFIFNVTEKIFLKYYGSFLTYIFLCCFIKQLLGLHSTLVSFWCCYVGSQLEMIQHCYMSLEPFGVFAIQFGNVLYSVSIYFYNNNTVGYNDTSNNVFCIFKDILQL